MMPLHPSFRRLVLQNIPQLDREDLDNYDSLLALRMEFVHQRSHVGKESRGRLDELINEVTQRANGIIKPYRTQFDALHKLWSARRSLALHQGGILQVPSSWIGLKGLVGALTKYLLVAQALQLPAFIILAWGRLTSPFRRRSSKNRGDDGNDHQSPKDPGVATVQQ